MTKRAQLKQEIAEELLLLRQERREVERITDALKAETRALRSLLHAMRKAKRVVRHIRPAVNTIGGNHVE